MRCTCLFLLFTMLIFANACAQRSETVTTFILLRHAEKATDGTDDPDLKPEGVERAERIAAMFKNTHVDAIYSTRYKRTTNTIALLARTKNLSVQHYEAHKPDAIEDILKKHAGRTVVVCGHSNNIPWTANLLLGKEEYKNYDDAEYGIILIVSVIEKGKLAKVTRLDY